MRRGFPPPSTSTKTQNYEPMTTEQSNLAARCLANNNPLMLPRSSKSFRGLGLPTETTTFDPDYFQFKTIEWGIAAAAQTMRQYMQNKQATNVQQITYRWQLPAGYNQADFYNDVTVHLPYSSLAPLRYTERERICQLLQAMTVVLSGQFFAISVFLRAYNQAL